jgi:hypothetical protein
VSASTEVGHLAQHAVAARIREAALQVVQRGPTHQRRHLRKPARGDARHHVDDRLRARLAAQSGQRVQDREIGLAGAVELDALAARDAFAVPPGDGEERLDERRLADPGLPGDEHHSPLPPLGLGHPLAEAVELRLAADHRGGPARGRGGHGRPGARVRDEPVPAPVQRLDDARCRGVVPEPPPEVTDTHGEGRVADRHVRPDRAPEGLLGDEPPGAGDQDLQDRKRLGGQADLVTAAPDAAVLAIEPEGAERDERVVRRHELVPQRTDRETFENAHDFPPGAIYRSGRGVGPDSYSTTPASA